MMMTSYSKFFPLPLSMKLLFKLFNKATLFSFLIASSTVFSSVYADEEAMKLLNRMNKALHQLSYTGTLAYLRGNTLSTLHIEHLVNNGVESERVMRMNEAGSEISRELAGFSLASIPQIRPEMLKVYSFDLGRQNRVANIPCTIITARPKDRARYLQKYCIDTSTGMLLDYMLVGKSHKPVEQFMFTTIDIQVTEAGVSNIIIEEEQLSSNALDGMPNAGVTSLVQAVTPVMKSKKTVIAANHQNKFRQISHNNLEDGWVMEALPAGYEINQAPSMKNTNGESATDSMSVTKHYIVSDGLSSLSVFVSPLTDDAPSKAVKINSGALNVVTQHKGGHVITVVGEVPESTLKKIVDSMHKK